MATTTDARQVYYAMLCEVLYDDEARQAGIVTDATDVRVVMFLDEVWRDPYLRRWLCAPNRAGAPVSEPRFLNLLLNFTTARRDVTTEQLMGQASRTLKNLADRLGLCVVLLSQINRSQSNMRPSLSVIRDSGQIAEAADMVIFCWRPSAYHGSYDLDFADYTTSGTMAFLLLKNREGALLERLMRWVSEHTLPIDIPDHELATYRKGYMTEGTLFE